MNQNHLRHHEKHGHLNNAFGGDDLFGRAAEAFARFFGTPLFMFLQTIGTIAWFVLNIIVLVKHWDPYPFFLLNMTYTIQSGFAAPLILCAQTRQADRDKAHADADARHREELAQQHREQADQILALTNEVHRLSITINDHVSEIKQKV